MRDRKKESTIRAAIIIREIDKKDVLHKTTNKRMMWYRKAQKIKKTNKKFKRCQYREKNKKITAKKSLNTLATMRLKPI